MAITTEFVLRSTSLPLVSIPTALRPDEVECVHALCLQPDVQIFTVQFEREDGVTKADLLTRDEVVAADAIGETADKDVYKLTVELAESVSKAFEPDFGGAQLEPTVVTADGWHETKVFKEYEGFNEFRESCETHGISLDLVSIASEGSASDEPTDSLTDRQREALTLAVSRGYYESPRQITAEELAAELGISQPSLSSLLRRGERELITSSLGMQARMQPPTQ
ncbi:MULTISPECIES: helix-turn-helix domain-containing protein [Haloferax]|uniref:DNA binding protein n=2 Tax=Haloferax TaxID=2251 RepID=M0IFP6_HALVO|nr:MULTISPECIES: helix-turn-helix domain-containing protein [Haloferax]ELZ95590.1 DNA binding protein [Haloferax alexandrinus JCM 10717]RDZ30995.1 bacterio-opsin activator [Haloferax sp. Atlit-48N]RDZ34171.1 bacterio-opsin activator [Haloferax sp. Atlit-24N]RDZ38373.1 bacterio-opsin activator [Haloferax sp. Atlit-47N]RLM36126.1 bacterio-opsin activator [Haloferax sp. Atlit-109R]